MKDKTDEVHSLNDTLASEQKKLRELQWALEKEKAKVGRSVERDKEELEVCSRVCACVPECPCILHSAWSAIMLAKLDYEEMQVMYHGCGLFIVLLHAGVHSLLDCGWHGGCELAQTRFDKQAAHVDLTQKWCLFFLSPGGGSRLFSGSRSSRGTPW